jgi:short-subunit dehydrogenase
MSCFLCSSFLLFVKFLGLIGLFKIIAYFYEFLSKKFSPKNTTLGQKYGEGSYVLITGGANGIGLGFAKQFALQGFNLILLDIDGEKLKKEKQALEQISTNPNFDCIVKVKNFKNSYKADFFREIGKELEGLDISVIVNNVGIGLKHEYQAEQLHSIEEYQTIIQVNILAQVGITSQFLPNMIQRAKNKGKKSALIAMSSASATNTQALLATYGATKKFNSFMNRALGATHPEYIDCVAAQPCFVRTAINKDSPIAKAMEEVACDVDECVEGVLKSLGKFSLSNGTNLHERLLMGMEVKKAFNYTTWTEDGLADYVVQDVMGYYARQTKKNK